MTQCKESNCNTYLGEGEIVQSQFVEYDLCTLPECVTGIIHNHKTLESRDGKYITSYTTKGAPINKVEQCADIHTQWDVASS